MPKQILSKTIACPVGKRSFSFGALSVGVLAMALLISFIVLAQTWKEPETSPPGGNVPAPINIGSTGQTKTGNLGLGGMDDNFRLTVVNKGIKVTNTGTIYTLYIEDESNDTTPFVIDTAGNVGIGTASPGERLTVAGNIDVGTNRIKSGSYELYQYASDYLGLHRKTAGRMMFALSPTGAVGDGIRLQFRLTNTDFFADQINYEDFQMHWSNNEFTMGTAKAGTGTLRPYHLLMGATKIMTFSTDGNVGIGTTSPDPNHKLTVAEGSLRSQGAYFEGNVGVGYSGTSYSLTVNGQNVCLADGTNCPAGTTLWAVSGTNIYNTNTGNVGIGDTTPASLLTVGSGDLFQVDSSGNIIRIRGITYSWPSAQGGSNTFLRNDETGTLSWVTAGTVTSVGLSAPTEFIVSGSPVTTSGTLTLSKANQSANLVYAGPSSGAAAAPTFRALVAADIPSLDASKITTGRFHMDRMPDGATSGYVLTAKGTRVNPAWEAVPGVTWPLLSTLDGTTAAPAYSWSADTNMGIRRGGTGDLRFVTAGSDRVTITSDGNVGIGTTAPKAKLDVRGKTYINPRSGFYSEPTIDLAIGDTDTGLHWISDGNLAVYTNNVERMRINSDGNVGIGTPTPGAKLHVAGDMKIDGTNTLEFGAGIAKEEHAGKIGYQTFTADALDIVGAGTLASNRKIRFWNEGGAFFQGNVGIGTTNLGTNKLKVAGNTEVTGNLTVGGGIGIGEGRVSGYYINTPSNFDVTTGGALSANSANITGNLTVGRESDLGWKVGKVECHDWDETTYVYGAAQNATCDFNTDVVKAYCPSGWKVISGSCGPTRESYLATYGMINRYDTLPSNWWGDGWYCDWRGNAGSMYLDILCAPMVLH